MSLWPVTHCDPCLSGEHQACGLRPAAHQRTRPDVVPKDECVCVCKVEGGLRSNGTLDTKVAKRVEQPERRVAQPRAPRPIKPGQRTRTVDGKRVRLDVGRRNSGWRRWEESELERARAMVASGSTLREVATALGRDHASVWRKLKAG